MEHSHTPRTRPDLSRFFDVEQLFRVRNGDQPTTFWKPAGTVNTWFVVSGGTHLPPPVRAHVDQTGELKLVVIDISFTQSHVIGYIPEQWYAYCNNDYTLARPPQILLGHSDGYQTILT